MNTTPRKFFIEDNRTGKWLKMPQSFDDCLIDTSRNSREEEDRKWTNDPLLAMSFDTFDEAELHNKKYWNMVDIEVTEHEFVNLPTPTSDKKLTPMAAHIEWLKKERKTLYEFGYDVAADRISAAIDNATSLLEAEREMGESTWDDAYAVGCVVGGNDYTNEQDEDTGFHYFTQNYRQQ